MSKKSNGKKHTAEAKPADPAKRPSSEPKKPDAPAAETAAETAEPVKTAEPEKAAAPAEGKPESKWNKKVSPVLGYGLFFGVLAVAVAIGLLVCLL